jgi:hypothetical protein
VSTTVRYTVCAAALAVKNSMQQKAIFNKRSADDFTVGLNQSDSISDGLHNIYPTEKALLWRKGG